MFDKAEYWLNICEEDISTVKSLLDNGKLLWAGFICHLIAEKALKAIIADKTNEVPPRIHDLPRLAKIADIFEDLSYAQRKLLRQLMPLQIEARYPEFKQNLESMLTIESCRQLFSEVEEFLCWIKQRLGK